MNFVIDEHFPSISSDDPDKYLVIGVTFRYFSVISIEDVHADAVLVVSGVLLRGGECNGPSDRPLDVGRLRSRCVFSPL